MKAYGEVDISSNVLASALDESECAASRPCRFTCGGGARGSHLIGWAGPRTFKDVMEKRKSLASVGNRTPIPRTPIQ
jgi:hypothetical protein